MQSLAIVFLGLACVGRGVEALKASEGKQTSQKVEVDISGSHARGPTQEQIAATALEVPKPFDALARLLLASNPACGWQVAGTAGRAVNNLNRNCARARSMVMETPSEAKVSDPLADMKDGKFDRDKSFEAMGELLKKFQALNEAKDLSEEELSFEEREEKVKELIDTYLMVSVPMITFGLIEISLTLASFGLFFFLLSVSPYNWSQLVELLSGVPVLGEFLKTIPENFGNFGIASLLTDAAALVLFPTALAVTPKYTESFRAWLDERGINTEGLNEMAKKIASSQQ